MNERWGSALDLLLVALAWLLLVGLTGFLVVHYAQSETSESSETRDLLTTHDLERLVERLEPKE